jgi:hypothetical protein
VNRIGGKSPKKRPRPKPSDDFEAVARRLGCDDDKDRFEARLGTMLRSKTPNKKTK